jgi:hypothetical protein
MTDAVDRVAEEIVNKLRELPDDARPKSSDLRREMGVTISVWQRALQRLRWQGKLEFGSLTLAHSLRQSSRTAPSQGAETEGGDALAKDASPAAGGVARDGEIAVAQVIPAASPPVVTGEQLAAELEAAAAAAGQTLHHFLAPIRFGLHGARYIEQLRGAKRPKPRTIERIRAFLRGELPEQYPGEEYAGGTEGSLNREYSRHRLHQTNQERERQQGLRQASELGKSLRQPGETLADAVRRECDDLGDRRRDARKLSTTVHDPIDLAKRCPHNPKARKFEPLPPQIWAALKALADEQGAAPMELLPAVVEQGIAAMRGLQ